MAQPGAVSEAGGATSPAAEPAPTPGGTVPGVEMPEAVNPDLLLSVSGVVVAGAGGTSSCVPLCVMASDPGADTDGDDRSLENGMACIIPGTITGASPSCTPGAPLPAPSALPGVVVDDAEGARCVALCLVNTTLPVDPAAGDWAFEGVAPCLIPGTFTARANQACTTTQPLPVPRQIPGVVVVDVGVPRCAPLCLIVLDVASDPDGALDGWSFENNLSCVVPGTDTARANQPCTTGGALPDATPRPGLLLADGLGSACRPLCQVVTTASSADALDWGYEQNAPCVLPGSMTAAGGTRACTFGGPALDLTLPALPGAKVAAGFFVRGGRLRDAYGADFVIRGVNNPHYWFDTAGQYLAYGALDSIASYGTNTIRVVWETDGPVSLLREILHRIVQLKMVPMVELHDVTSSTSAADLLRMAQYYSSADVKQVLDEYREYLLINIANEWSGNDFLGSYRAAVTLLRNNGVTHTLVIDANGFGQNGQAILDNAAALTNADPQRNLLFSVHMYEAFATTQAVDNMLQAATNQSIPLIVGEFGWQHGGRAVAWERILSRTNDLGIGYIAWSWLGNDPETAQLDMASDWSGPLTDWGADVLTGAAGNIRSTSERASIFE
jgi:mannan endo-1,4-beta-mannosidase